MSLKYDCMWFNMDDHGMIMGCLEWLYVGRNCFMVFFHGDIVMIQWEIHGKFMGCHNGMLVNTLLSYQTWLARKSPINEFLYEVFMGKLEKLWIFQPCLMISQKGISGSHRFDPSNLWRTKITKYESTTHLRLQIKKRKYSKKNQP